MVKNTGLLLIFLMLNVFLPRLAVAEVGMHLQVDKKTIALGEALTVELRVEGVRETISVINLDQLKKNFNVYGVSVSAQEIIKKGRHIKTEIMTLTLYPLRSGKLQIPALSYNGKKTPALTVNVLEFSKQVSQVTFKTAIDTLHPQVRMASTLTLDIYDDGTLQWTVPHEIVATGAHQRRLAESQHEETLDGTRYTVHHYAWALMPLREGSMKVEFPLLDAFKFGTRLRYSIPSMRFDALPLPAYLPVHVPVGKPVLTMQPLPTEIALNTPVNWVLNIEGAGLSAEGLSKLLSSISSNAAIRFYPLKVAQDETVLATSARQTFQITVPFAPLQTGPLQLPTINLPYYDPARARVESVVYTPDKINVFNPAWIIARKIAWGLFLLIVIPSVGYALYKKILRARKRRQSLSAISRAVDAKNLHALLLNFNGGLPAFTLQQWLLGLQQKVAVDEGLRILVQKLEAALYGEKNSGSDISKLAQEFVELLRKVPGSIGRSG